MSDLPDLLDSWLIALRDEGKSRHTIAAYGDSVKALIRWQETTGKHGLTREAVSGFLASILDGDGHGGQDATANLRARCIRLFSKWAYEEGRTDADELSGLKAPRIGKRIVPKLSDDELKRLIAVTAADKSFRGRRDEALIRLAAETTARCDELVQMDFPADIDLKRGIAIIRKGKGGGGRVVPFGSHAARALDRYLHLRKKAGHGDGPLWISGHKGRLSYSGLYHTLGERAEAAGVPDFHPHRLRHTAASRWLAAGGSEQGLMAVAGWRSRSMLDRYTEDTAAERAIDEARRLNLGEV